jgi:lysyl-tRNA synthetase class II
MTDSIWQPNKLEEERLQKVQELEARGVEAYPRRVQRTHTAAEAIAAYEAL